MSEIDHEAAKNVCHARLAQDMHPSSSDRNIARAYLDLDAQLAAERARVQKLAGLVESAYQQGYEACSKNSVSPTELWPHTYNSSDTKEQLATILEGRNAHAANGETNV